MSRLSKQKASLRRWRKRKNRLRRLYIAAKRTVRRKKKAVASYATPVNSINGTHFSWEEALHNSGYTSLAKVPPAVSSRVKIHAANMERLRAKVNDARGAHGLSETSVNVISWIRSPAHNRAVGGASQSRHMQGDATDIAREEILRLFPWKNGPRDFDNILDSVFAAGGVGLYLPGNRHCDSRGYRARWTIA